MHIWRMTPCGRRRIPWAIGSRPPWAARPRGSLACRRATPMQPDLLEAANGLELDTSIGHARSRVDGRVYPVEPLSGDQIDELARCLDLAVDLRIAWALADA